ncbi:damage-inducible protein D [Comamonas sp. 26]|uniref:damage-inducible protein D n=1 Tax=Comamonas sp. 26 TaxID=2035201 RepID=UPI000C3AE813|nr:damage-inducible protein D [Comamonas sp. 26]PIG09488.1 DNA-damage-inducible protein D [Comamonas sp. 26]
MTSSLPSLAELMSFDLDNFEKNCHEDGGRHWLAHQFMSELGYDSWPAFQGVLLKAQATCARLELSPSEAFIPSTIIEDGQQVKTYKLTRFACLLTTLHADERKPPVAAAKVALAGLVDQVIAAQISQQNVGRIEAREDLKAAELGMSAAAKFAGVQNGDYGLLRDAGIRGMYNRSLRDLKALRGLSDKDTPYDHMGLTELAGNLFRVTQTSEKLRTQPNVGLPTAKNTAQTVGADVRRIMINNSGIAPEALPPAEDIRNVKRGLKQTAKAMGKLDKPTKKK